MLPAKVVAKRLCIHFWPIIQFFLGLALAGGISCLAASTLDDFLRISGLFLQLLGIATVAIGLNLVRRRFGKSSLVLEWFQKLPTIFKPQTIYPKAVSGTATGGRVHLSVEINKNLPLGEQIVQLERKLTTLEVSIHDGLEKLDKEHSEKIKKVKDSLVAEDKALRNFLEEVSVGGIALEFTGVLWLTVGVVLATVPDMIARFIS